MTDKNGAGTIIVAGLMFVSGAAITILHYVSPHPPARMHCYNCDCPQGWLGVRWAEDHWHFLGLFLLIVGVVFVGLGVRRLCRRGTPQESTPLAGSTPSRAPDAATPSDAEGRETE